MFAGASLGTYTVLYPYITKLVFDSTSVKWHLGALFLVNNAKRFSGASSDYVEIELKKGGTSGESWMGMQIDLP